ncbi:hypothetical protein SteCoe_29253 [Stentor coeruleus]|uniref:Uncharacterized protein n=1 Tax=Stentor coeruleus TaxID=5963 RepID=A0A1R2B6B3_9CILI|nr:hypothetical protein SteCoe_29253 [Stentor coeruleus]
METLRKLGLFLILAYFLIVSTLMLSDYKAWESQLFSIAKPAECLVCKKYLTEHSRCIIQTLGTIGIILSFFGFYGCKYSIKTLALTTLIWIMLSTLNLNNLEQKNIYVEIINIFKMLGIAGGLLEAY